MKKIDAHVHIDQFEGEPGPDFDFMNPPKPAIVVEKIIQNMDEQGVESAVIMQHPNGPLDDEIVEAMAKYPGRFKGAMIVPLDDEKTALETVDREFARGLDVIKLEMFGTTMIYKGIKINQPIFYKIFEKADKLGITIAIDPFRPGGPGYQYEEIEEVVQKFPNLTFVICHLGFPFAASFKEDPANEEKYQKMIALAKYNNVYFDGSAQPDMFGDFEPYPWTSGLQRLRAIIDKFGPDKAMWGSDIPGEFTKGTYKQFVDMFLESDLFTDEEKEKFFYTNAKKVYFDK